MTLLVYSSDSNVLSRAKHTRTVKILVAFEERRLQLKMKEKHSYCQCKILHVPLVTSFQLKYLLYMHACVYSLLSLLKLFYFVLATSYCRLLFFA